MNEFTGTPETVEEALQLHHRISSNALFILFLCSHKHDTKPGALLFIVHRGRLALSWMGWIRYVLPVRMPALRLSHSEALQQGTDMAMAQSLYIQVIFWIVGILSTHNVIKHEQRKEEYYRLCGGYVLYTQRWC